MDPTVCYLWLLQSLIDQDYDTAKRLAIALHNWMTDNRGFYPLDTPKEQVESLLADLLARSVEGRLRMQHQDSGNDDEMDWPELTRKQGQLHFSLQEAPHHDRCLVGCRDVA